MIVTHATASSVPAGPLTSHAPPAVDLSPLAPAELDAWFRGGEPEADACEELLAWAARARGAIDVAIAEGLHALRQGDRLAELGCHLDDYAREVLDLGKRAAEGLARLGRELRTRPLLAEALRSGRVRLRAAQTVLDVAAGEAEAEWVQRAERLTVRELEACVRAIAAGGGGEDEDEVWVRLGAQLGPEERELVDEALSVAAKVRPGASRIEGLEAMAQEFLGDHPPEGEPPSPGGAFRRIGARDGRAAALECETERWAALPVVAGVPVPDLRFYETASAYDVDAKLRELARLRAGWDDVVGWCAHAVRKSGMHRLLGFATFRQYCEERLGLPARSVEQRAAVEERRWASPALQEAKRGGASFEKLRLLARLPEDEIPAWAARAQATTCVALRRELDGKAERQMRAQRKLLVPLPLRIAALVAAAVQAVRERLGRALPAGRCVAILAYHFLETWLPALPRSRSRSRRVRDRDDGRCQVPGCSHAGTQSHHVLFRSHGGGDEPENQITLCAFHHLRCIHGGYLRVVGRAPDELRWFLNGERWEGPRRDAR